MSVFDIFKGNESSGPDLSFKDAPKYPKHTSLFKGEPRKPKKLTDESIAKYKKQKRKAAGNLLDQFKLPEKQIAQDMKALRKQALAAPGKDLIGRAKAESLAAQRIPLLEQATRESIGQPAMTAGGAGLEMAAKNMLGRRLMGTSKVMGEQAQEKTNLAGENIQRKIGLLGDLPQQEFAALQPRLTNIERGLQENYDRNKYFMDLYETKQKQKAAAKTADATAKSQPKKFLGIL